VWAPRRAWPWGRSSSTSPGSWSPSGRTSRGARSSPSWKGSATDPEAECERYEAAIREAGGINQCVLGIGRNGHIGFNEPGVPFGSRTRVVRLTETTRKVNAGDFEERRAPERAITVSMATIFEAREVLLLASGANKAQAAAAALQGEISEAVPASMLRRRPNASFLLDQDAASTLDGTGT
jgi:glucosamine-6-phosphate deaminase